MKTLVHLSLLLLVTACGAERVIEYRSSEETLPVFTSEESYAAHVNQITKQIKADSGYEVSTGNLKNTDAPKVLRLLQNLRVAVKHEAVRGKGFKKISLGESYGNTDLAANVSLAYGATENEMVSFLSSQMTAAEFEQALQVQDQQNREAEQRAAVERAKAEAADRQFTREGRSGRL